MANNPHSGVTRDPKMVAKVAKLYARGLSQKDVGKKLGLPRQRVCKIMEIHGIAARQQQPAAVYNVELVACDGCGHYVNMHRGGVGPCLSPHCGCEAPTLKPKSDEPVRPHAPRAHRKAKPHGR